MSNTFLEVQDALQHNIKLLCSNLIDAPIVEFVETVNGLETIEECLPYFSTTYINHTIKSGIDETSNAIIGFYSNSIEELMRRVPKLSQFAEGLYPSPQEETMIQQQLDRCFISAYNCASNLHNKTVRLQSLMENRSVQTTGLTMRGSGFGAMLGTMLAPGIGTIIGGAIGGSLSNSAAKDKQIEKINSNWESVWQEYQNLLYLIDDSIKKTEKVLIKFIKQYFYTRYSRVYNNFKNISENPEKVTNLLGELNSKIYNSLEE